MNIYIELMAKICYSGWLDLKMRKKFKNEEKYLRMLRFDPYYLLGFILIRQPSKYNESYVKIKFKIYNSVLFYQDFNF